MRTSARASTFLLLLTLGALLASPDSLLAGPDPRTPAAVDRASLRPQEPPRHPFPLPFETVDKGQKSCWAPSGEPAIGGPYLLAFRNEADWNAFWAAHACGRAIPTPPIGFPERMAIAYISGEGSGTSAAAVKRIEYDRRRGRIFVFVEEENRTDLTPVILNPYHIVSCRNVPGRLVLRLDSAWPFRSIDQGGISGYRYGDPSFGGESMILRDEETYLGFWEKHTANQFPPPPPPGVDFAFEMVLGSLFGHWTDNGALIEIVRVTKTWFGALRVEVVKRAGPGPLDVITNPFHLVATPRWEGPVFFVDRSGPLRPPPPPAKK